MPQRECMSPEKERQPAIRFEHISLSYGETMVLNDFCLTIPEGEFLTVIGSSGGGKTTMLKLVNGLLKAVGAGHQGVEGHHLCLRRFAWSLFLLYTACHQAECTAKQKKQHVSFHLCHLLPHFESMGSAVFIIRMKFGRGKHVFEILRHYSTVLPHKRARKFLAAGHFFSFRRYPGIGFRALRERPTPPSAHIYETIQRNQRLSGVGCISKRNSPKSAAFS